RSVQPEHHVLRHLAIDQRRIAPKDHPVVSTWGEPAGELHAQVVLVGEEEWHRIIDDLTTQHRTCGGWPTVVGVRPVLDPDPAPGDSAGERGDVATGIDVWIGGTQRGISHHTVVHV